MWLAMQMAVSRKIADLDSWCQHRVRPSFVLTEWPRADLKPDRVGEFLLSREWQAGDARWWRWARERKREETKSAYPGSQGHAGKEVRFRRAASQGWAVERRKDKGRGGRGTESDDEGSFLPRYRDPSTRVFRVYCALIIRIRRVYLGNVR